MSTCRLTKDALDFEGIKKQISSLESKIKSEHFQVDLPSNDKNHTEEKKREFQKEIQHLKDILQKSPPLPELPPKNR